MPYTDLRHPFVSTGDNVENKKCEPEKMYEVIIQTCLKLLQE